MEDDAPKSISHPFRRFIFIMIGCCVALLVLTYVVEDFRGWRAMKKFTKESVKRGVNLDWNAMIPARVPGDDNFFGAPNMQKWFIGRGTTPFSAKISFGNFQNSPMGRAVAQVTVVPSNAVVAPSQADIVLDFEANSISEPLNIAKLPAGSVPNSLKVPLISFDKIPLQNAIQTLAQQAGINYTVDQSVNFKGGNLRDATVSCRWPNLTGYEALIAMLQNYRLHLVPNYETGIYNLEAAERNSTIDAPASLRNKIGGLIVNAVAASTNSTPARHLRAPLMFDLVADAPKSVKPVRIVVRTDHNPTIDEVTALFPRNPLGPNQYNQYSVSATVADDGFAVYINPQPQVSAQDYLVWSDQFTNDFDNIREALQRPYARMTGDYNDPVKIPIPNFVTLRTFAQTIAQRAQCYMLLNQPDQALREVTLLHDMSRIMIGQPQGKPMTLVAAMVNVAVNGLYVSVVGDGLRLQVWREPQLAVLQQQLADVELLPPVREAFEFESMIPAHFAHAYSSRQLAEIQYSFYGSTPKSLADKLRNPMYDYLLVAPRGWIYQNAVIGSGLEQAMLETIDVTNHLILPRQVDAQVRKVDKAFKHLSPYNAFATQFVPNFTRAVQTAAKNQTFDNEAVIVCALERFKLARGYYPESLDRLVPQYAKELPTDLFGGGQLHYRVENGEFVLYSEGWNETDDGGKPSPGLTQYYNEKLAQGDWNWPYQKAPEN